jgi:hypothetical protein
VIIAAYGRPEALRPTLASVLAQSEQDFEVLVVADACPPDALEAMRHPDPRVRLLNLPRRAGHQYGPNAVGLARARGEFIAFLNHDDLWLRDHLARARAALGDDPHGFHFARAAFCHYAGQAHWQATLGRLVFSEFNQPQATWRCLDGPNALFEPASAWVLPAALARRIGPWRPPGTVARTPVMDWVCLAARAGARFSFGDAPTVLKLNLHHPPHQDQPTYAMPTPDVADLADWLEASPDRVRARLADDIAQAPGREGLLARDLLANPPQAADPAEADALARYTALRAGAPYGDEPDAAAWREAALASLALRTGEHLPGFPPVDALLAGTVPA